MPPTGADATGAAAARRRSTVRAAPRSNNAMATDEMEGTATSDAARDEFAKQFEEEAAAAEEEGEEEQEEEHEDEDRDDKSWRTRGESTPSVGSLVSPRSLGDMPAPLSRSWNAASEPRRKRQVFWRHVVRQYNFVDQEDERALLLSLTRGIDWRTMALLPRAFMARHKEIYFLICRGDYARSSMIQRDVTRTFSIFERSQLPRRERDVDAQQRALFRVLNAVAEAEDGYCQGMNFIAALFLVEGLAEDDAYALFVYLLRRRHLARLYHHSSTFLDDYLLHFERLFEAELPDLFAHMRRQGFATPMYGIEWFTTLFSLSTKPDLACAIFDLFFVGVQDVFLRVGLAVLKLLEAPLMCMGFEDFLRDFKPLVRQLDPYHVVLQALACRPNAAVATGEDTTTHIARLHLQRHAAAAAANPTAAAPPRAFHRHRSLPPELARAVEQGDVAAVSSLWLAATAARPSPFHALVAANEILHFAVWHGRAAVALLALRQCGADVDGADDTGLSPLHFAVVRNEPDLVRVLLAFGADETRRGGRWSGASDGLTPLETARHWTFRDTAAARLVLERAVCLCCNARLHAFAFHRESCAQCKFPFCGRGAMPCIERHQCPATLRRRRRPQRQRPSEYDGDDDDDGGAVAETATATATATLAAEEDAAGTTDAPSSSSSRRSSRSASDLSSSFVYIHSPAAGGGLPADLHHAHDALTSSATTGSTATTSTETSTSTTTSTTTTAPTSGSLLGSLVDWLGGVADSPRPRRCSLENDDDDADAGSDAAVDDARRRGLEFPARPAWYCNATGCHATFAFFSRRDACVHCGGFFCGVHVDAAATQRCAPCSHKSESLQ